MVKKNKKSSSNISANQSPPYGITTVSKKIIDSPVPNELYNTIEQEKTQHQFSKFGFDDKQFIQYWQNNENKPSFKRAARRVIQIGTIENVLKSKYTWFDQETQKIKSRNLHKNDIETSIITTKKYENGYNFNKFPNDFSTEILIISGDCLETAISLNKKKSCNSCVLVMASTSLPGGGYRKAAGSQEENIWFFFFFSNSMLTQVLINYFKKSRRSSLFQNLDYPYSIDGYNRQWSYPLPEFGGIYSPKVTVFRASENNGYKYLKNPKKISFINVGAYKDPPTTEDYKYIDSKSLIKNIKKKMILIFNIALDNGHDSIVLSSFGCGAYSNPPLHIAELFKEVIQQNFLGCFKFIVFGILDDMNSFKKHNPQGNLIPFELVFNTNSILLQD